MKSILLLMLILSTTPHLFAQNKWEFITSVSGSGPKVAISDTNTCFIITTIGMSNWLSKSIDQGKNWSLLKDEKDFKDVEFTKHISAIDTSNFYITFHKAVIYRTSDGGATMERFSIDSIVQVNSIAMLNETTGAISNASFVFLTRTKWVTKTTIDFGRDGYFPIVENLRFLNDSILLATIYDIYSETPFDSYLLKLNINSLQSELFFIDYIPRNGLLDLCIVNDQTYFVCSESNHITGGSGQDIIYKTTDGGRNWRCVLDLYTQLKMSTDRLKFPPFGLQNIDFKDSLTGIAVGQFGKIVYTYDGGESWIYEDSLPMELGKPATMKIRYAGSMPIIVDYGGQIFRLKEDHLAPKPNDTATICGRVTFNGEGQARLPILIGNRITMTDSLGYYKFTRLPAGIYIVRAVNKYQSNPESDYYHKPFIYIPDSIVVAVTDKVCDVNFTAIDNRTYYYISGMVRDPNGKPVPNVTLKVADKEGKTTQVGNYKIMNVEAQTYYTLRPYSDEYTFDPENILVHLKGNTPNQDFIAYPLTSITEPELEKLLRYESSTLLVSPDCLTCTITITDITGRELFRQPAKPELVLSWLPRGVYFITLLRGNEAVETLKMVKE